MLEFGNLLIVKIEQGKSTLPQEKINLYKFALHKNLEMLVSLVKR